MTPFRNTMCFVYSKQRNASSASQALQASHYPAGPLTHPSINQNSVLPSIANLDDIVHWQSPQVRRTMSGNCSFFASGNEIKFLSCQTRKFVRNTEMSVNSPWKRFGTNVDQTISAIHGFPFHSVVGLTGAKKTRRNS